MGDRSDVTGRREALQRFLDAAFMAFDRHAVDIRSRDSIMQLFALLAVPAQARTTPGQRLPVCDRILDATLGRVPGDPALGNLLECFRAIEPELE